MAAEKLILLAVVGVGSAQPVSTEYYTVSGQSCSDYCKGRNMACDITGQSFTDALSSNKDLRGGRTCNPDTPLKSCAGRGNAVPESWIPTNGDTSTATCFTRTWDDDWNEEDCAEACYHVPMDNNRQMVCPCRPSCASYTCAVGWTRIPNAANYPQSNHYGCCYRNGVVPSTAEGVTWLFAAEGASCDEACSANNHQSCNVNAMATLKSDADLLYAISQADPNYVCQLIEEDDTYAAHVDTRAPFGCNTATVQSVSCAHKPVDWHGYRLLCPCNQVEKKTCDQFNCQANGLGWTQRPNAANYEGDTQNECCVVVVPGGGGTGSMPDLDILDPQGNSILAEQTKEPIGVFSTSASKIAAASLTSALLVFAVVGGLITRRRRSSQQLVDRNEESE